MVLAPCSPASSRSPAQSDLGPTPPALVTPLLILTMGSLSAGRATAHGAPSQVAVTGCSAAVLRAWWV